MSIILNQLKKEINETIIKLDLKGELIIEKTKSIEHADYATNFALINSKLNNLKPLELAEKIKENLLKNNKIIKNVEVAKPGFINIEINGLQLVKVLDEVQKNKENYGRSANKNYTFNLELISANPTGFLHIGHARNGIVGDSVRRILEFAGYNVQTEYYTNDAGNQVNVLAVTVFYYYLLLLKVEVEKPEEIYGGDMYEELAQNIINKYGDKFKSLKINNNKINDPETHELFRNLSINYFINIIKEQIDMLDIKIEHYSSEQKMYDDKLIDKMLNLYKNIGKTYEKDNALWLKTTEFGDDKDRVLKKSDGSYTYITPDIACHDERIRRTNADKYVNFWGGDHHGYITRVRAGLALLNHRFDILDIDIIQMVRLIKDGKEFKMSKRKGTAVWLIDLIEMVGKDAIRYMLASKNPSSHMDFDIDLVVERNSTNPVYYAQYATARCKKLLDKFNSEIITDGTFEWNSKEKELIMHIDDFNSTIEHSASKRLPNVLCDYIQKLAKLFHSYYGNDKIIDLNNVNETNKKLLLVSSIYQVLVNSLTLIGVDFKDYM
ncbi:arginine--tRNA ligase [Spiroplasma turonicum]|uniref:Arginine--tRNA ligase n=1 Tax=Spiroplasma turonicum TaxID=216946 RepID=A0A0K1P7P8_9MOLU|nr:arginine--tRNA ligase [Spiroplasma turonicum]AKU80323.1 arginyl-tRNA synthetase [Spiroplasma turonicum]ALX71324.1 arginyl-tRNA synthetase [Spiroplasma turonicum]